MTQLYNTLIKKLTKFRRYTYETNNTLSPSIYIYISHPYF